MYFVYNLQCIECSTQLLGQLGIADLLPQEQKLWIVQQAPSLSERVSDKSQRAILNEFARGADAAAANKRDGKSRRTPVSPSRQTSSSALSTIASAEPRNSGQPQSPNSDPAAACSASISHPDSDNLAQKLRDIKISDDATVVADMTAKLRRAGIFGLEDLQGLSPDEVKEAVAELKLNPVQLRRLCAAVTKP